MGYPVSDFWSPEKVPIVFVGTWLPVGEQLVFSFLLPKK
jgi:hypothetical protein